MTYEKPEVVAVLSAIDVIQGTKRTGVCFDAHFEMYIQSPLAYEADE